MKLASLSDFTKEYAILHLMGVEGDKYTDIKEDRGGKTRYGIIEQTAVEYKHLWSAHNFTGDMSALPASLAYAIYEEGWWNKLKLDDVCKINPIIAERLLDIGINSGRGTAAKFLQRILNLFNDRQRLYKDIAVDGGIGNQTLSTLRQLISIRGVGVIKNIALQLYVLQGHLWFNLAEKDESQETFTFGWSNRSVNSIDDFYKLL